MAKIDFTVDPVGVEVDKGLQTLVDLAKEEAEVGEIVCGYTDARNTGEKVTKSDFLAGASSPAVAERAGRLLDVVDLLRLLKKSE